MPIFLYIELDRKVILPYKSISGMCHSGIGHTQVANFMSALDVPTMNHSSMKQRENEASRHILAVAQQSCEKSLEKEIAEMRKEDE